MNNGPISHFYVDNFSFHLAKTAIGLAVSIDKNINLVITQQMTVKVLG